MGAQQKELLISDGIRNSSEDMIFELDLKKVNGFHWVERRRKRIPVCRNSLNKIQKYFEVYDVFKEWQEFDSQEAHNACQGGHVSFYHASQVVCCL